MEYHVPVMLEECIQGLNIKPDGIYVDVTFGAGGHSRSILKSLNAKGRLLGFDQDDDAIENVPNDDRFTFVKANFKFLDRYLDYYGIKKVDGILADLGVSSHQLDEGSRGFSFRFEGPIDMRMNRFVKQTAADVLNTYSESHLVEVFSKYGQVRNSKTLAGNIVEERNQIPLTSMGQLTELLDKSRRGERAKYFAQVFQALRVEVNQELEVLADFLRHATDYLNHQGRLVVMSYHSLEDKLVKSFMKSGNAHGKVFQDDYGKIFRPYKMITKGVVMASDEEIKRNNRARSARLRIAERRIDGNSSNK